MPIFAFLNSSNYFNLFSPILNFLMLISIVLLPEEKTQNQFFDKNTQILNQKKELKSIKSVKNIINQFPVIKSIEVTDNKEVQPQIIEIESSKYDFNLNKFNPESNLNQSLLHYPIELKEKPLNLKYEFKRNTFFNLNNISTQVKDEAILKDFSFGLWYDFNSNFAVGAEFRQESFNIKKNDQPFNYNMNCWELAGRYISDVSILNSRVYLQSNLGGGTQGVTLRSSSGLLIPIFDELNLNAGVEFSTLIYNSKFENSNRIGLNLGIIFDLNK